MKKRRRVKKSGKERLKKVLPFCVAVVTWLLPSPLSKR